jgi:hypothetical protein
MVQMNCYAVKYWSYWFWFNFDTSYECYLEDSHKSEYYNQLFRKRPDEDREKQEQEGCLMNNSLNNCSCSKYSLFCEHRNLLKVPLDLPQETEDLYVTFEFYIWKHSICEILKYNEWLFGCVTTCIQALSQEISTQLFKLYYKMLFSTRKTNIVDKKRIATYEY